MSGTDKIIDDTIKNNKEIFLEIFEAVRENRKEDAIGKMKSVMVSGYYRPYYTPDKLPENNVFGYEYTTGGAAGGNCWGDDALEFTSYQSVMPEPGVIPAILLSIIENSSKEISLGDAARLMRIIGKLEEEYEYTECEYYGNYNDKTVRYADGDKVYEFLRGFV